MAILVKESWICDQGEFEILFNDVTNTVFFTGPSVIQLSSNCETARGKAFGAAIFSYCDGTDLKQVKATNLNPFFFIDTVTNGCAVCDRVISGKSKTDPSTAGASDGTISFTVTTSAANPTYQLRKKVGGVFVDQGSEVAITSGVPVTINGLNAGEYAVLTDEDLGCKPNLSFYTMVDGAECGITFDSAITVDETAPNADDGQATISALGGTGTLEYSLTDLSGSYQTSNVFTGLAPGNYTVYIREQATPTCKATGQFTINPAAGSPPPERVSEVKTVKVKHDCFVHPIYLCWLNSLGGWDYWLFEYDHINTLKVSGGEDIQRPIREISTQEIIRETINRTSNKAITVGAENLEKQEFIAISEILDSRQVYWMRVVNGQVKRLAVKVLTQELQYNERDELHPIRLQIELPDKFLIQ